MSRVYTEVENMLTRLENGGELCLENRCLTSVRYRPTYFVGRTDTPNEPYKVFPSPSAGLYFYNNSKIKVELETARRGIKQFPVWMTTTQIDPRDGVIPQGPAWNYFAEQMRTKFRAIGMPVDDEKNQNITNFIDGFLQTISTTKEWLLEDYGEKESGAQIVHCVNPACPNTTGMQVQDCGKAWSSKVGGTGEKCGSKKRCPNCPDDELYGGITSNPVARAERSWKKHFHDKFVDQQNDLNRYYVLREIIAKCPTEDGANQLAALLNANQ